MAEQPGKTVFALPYLRLSSGKYGVKEVRVGPAQFWPDEEETWTNFVKAPRPPWLDIYREFPPADGESAPAARGTILFADDDEWLRQPGHGGSDGGSGTGVPGTPYLTPVVRFRGHRTWP